MLYKAHLPNSPKRVHRLLGVRGIKGVDFSQDQVVKDAVFRHVVVQKLRHRRAQKRQKNALGRPAHILIFKRRLANHGRVKYWVLLASYRRDLHHWKQLDRRVKASVIAKWPLKLALDRIDKALYNVVGVVRDINFISERLYKLGWLFADKAIKKQLKDALWQRRLTAPDIEWIGAYCHRDWHLTACALILVKEICAVFMYLPVHAKAIFIINLQSIHA